MKMRDFYTRVIGLTITDEDPERGSCFLSAAPEHEHHELNLGQSRGPDHPDGARPRTQGVGQVSFIVPGLDDLRALHGRFQAEGTRILRTVTHGISVSIYFLDPEDNVGEVYYKTGYNVRQALAGPLTWRSSPTRNSWSFPNPSKRRLDPSRVPDYQLGRPTSVLQCSFDRWLAAFPLSLWERAGVRGLCHKTVAPSPFPYWEPQGRRQADGNVTVGPR